MINFFNFLFINPKILEYENHEGFEKNTYVCINCNSLKFKHNIYCRVKKLFWNIYIKDEREWPSWADCFKPKH